MAFNFGSTSKPTFGTPTTQNTSAFSFQTPTTPVAATSSTGLFGTPTKPVATTAFSFGSPVASTASTNLFGGGTVAVAPTTGLFGSTSNAPSTGLFGAPPVAAVVPSTSLFGNPATSSAISTTPLFGGVAVPPTTGLFGTKTSSAAFSFSTPTTSTSIFGAPAKPTTGLFGGTAPKTGLFNTGSTPSLFGGPTATTGGLFGIKSAIPSTSIFGAPAIPAISTVVDTNSKAVQKLLLDKSLTTPCLFGDERDATIAKWNQLQAGYGYGRAYYTQQGAFVQISADNPYCRLKAIGYSKIARSRNKDGLVMIIFKKKCEDVQKCQQLLIDGLQKLFVGKPNLTVKIHSCKPLTDDKTELLLYVEETSALGEKSRINAQTFFQFLSPAKSQLQSEMAVEDIYPKVMLTKDQIKTYLDTPPQGVDIGIWKQAIADNPDPENMIPVPMVGFEDLETRIDNQNRQAAAHESRLEIIAEELSSMTCNQRQVKERLLQYKKRLMNISHNLLQVIIAQEVERKSGFAANEIDEVMRNKYESVQNQLNCPTEYKAKLNGLISQVRMQSSVPSDQQYSTNNVQLSKNQYEAFSSQICTTNKGIELLVGLLNQGMLDLNTMKDVLKKVTQ